MKWTGRSSARDRGNLKLVYATRYCSDGAQGYVYLPARDEMGYEENSFTWYRPDKAGKWFPAAAGWDATVRRALGGAQR